MKRLTVIVLLIVLINALYPSVTNASWLLYHKQEFKGRVIDAKTKEPIAGAVVVATYYKSTIGVPHHYSTIIYKQETLTSQNGEFSIPSYTTLIQPLSVSSFVHFIIYKPGYGNFPWQQISPRQGVKEEEYFSGNLGKEGEVAWLDKTITVRFGVVELQKLETKEERLKAIPSSPGDLTFKELPLLFKSINEERRNFGLQEVQG